MKFDNTIASFAVFAFLIGLCVLIYSGFETTYSLHPDNINSKGQNIMEALNHTNFIAGIEQAIEGLNKISNPSNVFDVVGGLLTGGIGAVRSAFGIFSLVPETILVVTNFYTGWIPPIVSQIFGIIFSVYISMIILYYITGRGNG